MVPFKTSPPPPPRTFRATGTGRHTVTLPAALRRQLAIAPGDAGEITVEDGRATLRKAVSQAVPPLKGLLRDDFTDRDDTNRFVQEERSSREDRIARLDPGGDEPPE